MEIAFLGSAVVLSAAIVGCILKKLVPEISAVLTAVACVLVFGLGLGCVSTVKDFALSLSENISLPTGSTQVVLSVAGVGIVTKISSEICRALGESSLGAAIDFLGGVAAVLTSLPLWSGITQIFLSFM